MFRSAEAFARYLQSTRPALAGTKLHKVLYYAQAWSLVWDHRPLFPDRLEAWKQGPVSPHVFGIERHDGGLRAKPQPPDAKAVKTIAEVLRVYGARPAVWLSRLSHREDPWRQARQGLPDEAPSKAEISQQSMARYYGSLKWGAKKTFSDAFIRGLDWVVETPEDELELMRSAPTIAAAATLKWLETGDEDCDSSG
jgi:uncharacterized phage-associated protein